MDKQTIKEGHLHQNAQPIEYVRTVTGCWECVSHAPNTTGGYPRVARGNGQTPAHRYVYELLVGDIEEGKELCHRCDNVQCINPAHMFQGTHKENMDDRAAKGRNGAALGEAHGKSRLTIDEVVEIRRLYRSGGHTQKGIAGMFGVSRSAIKDVLTGRVWRHVEQAD